jgi:large subunit ribosomal protein L13
MIARKPTYPVDHAIRGMLPKNRLGRKLFTNVKVYAGASHPHSAQKPEPFVVE